MILTADRVLKFLKDWALILAIIGGIAGYFLFASLPWADSMRKPLIEGVTIVQPILIFCMLFITFSRINPRRLHLRPWHIWLLLIQGMLFAGIGVVLISMPHSGMRVVLEGAMLCLICPTATAGAVITGKLGGDVDGITAYTILINLLAALLVPLLVPLVHPNPQMDLLHAGFLILVKVFPLLLFPLLLAILVRKYLPKVNQWLANHSDISFYLWIVALALALAVTTRSIVHSTVDLATELWLVGVSFLCCILQFWLGRKIGGRYSDAVTAGQSFGQKNTVLAIWMGYTFFTPVTAIVGGFYSIWHNLVNSYQLYRARHTR